MNTQTRNPDGYTFPEWYAAADTACLDIAGLSIDDLPDGPSWDAWTDGVDPAEYAEQLLADEGFPF